MAIRVAFLQRVIKFNVIGRIWNDAWRIFPAKGGGAGGERVLP
jgi:hypothetical protein